ncbi:hypothetical protein FANTH_6366 [Fusarium anthophilum]|uniref:C2H2-type domain-containing protein n=1 Tax=Fusarium anthophilum TaxID=48485 RepID=A0A8H5E508_9HYPO|nr:hypothetical protein FANTH_6366 [Fusarium anthophilum]
MQLELEYRFSMENTSGLCNQPTSCPSSMRDFSSTSSTHQPFTLTPNLGNIVFAIVCNSVSHQAPLSVMGEPMFHSFNNEPEQILFPHPLPDESMEPGQLGFEYEQMIAWSMTDKGSMDLLTPSDSLGMDGYSPDALVSAASFKMTSSPGVSDSFETGYSYSCASASPKWLSSPGDLSEGIESPDQDWQFQPSPSAHDYKANNLNFMPDQLSLRVLSFQGKSTKLQQAHSRSPKKRSSKSRPIQVDDDQRAENKCDYSGCQKTFKRREHLKRHKASFHGEGPNRFLCEFCGKTQFNRQDNLNSHRKLHARRNGRGCGVVFVQGAVSIIRQEEKRRRRRSLSKLSMEGKHANQASYVRASFTEHQPIESVNGSTVLASLAAHE